MAKAHAMTLRVIGYVSSLPGHPSLTRILTDHSSSSIGANIAEGHGRFSLAAFRDHLQIARGSAAETDNWLAVLADQAHGICCRGQLHHDCSS
jgi:four helix bundle protein